MMSLKEDLAKISDCEFLPDEDLTSYTTFRLAAKGDLLRVFSITTLKKILPILKHHQRNYLVVGWGANQILAAHTPEIVIHLEFKSDDKELNELKDTYYLPASIGLNILTAHAIKFGLKGWEVFTGIPASLGGAIFMNAGTQLGEVGKLVRKVDLVTPLGELRTEIIGPNSFSYRTNHFVRAGEIIVGAELCHFGSDDTIPEKIKNYMDYRKKSQPLATKNCGCVFKNPLPELPAGKLIDLLQLKGVGTQDLRISPKHGNFMENNGRANWDQFQALVGLIQHQMDHFYGIEFELEVKIPYD